MQLLGWLGVRRALKRTYCRLFGPDGGVVSLEVDGVTIKLLVHTQLMADDLKGLQGEGPMLELMMKTLRPGDCAYDVGAEMGLFTFFLAKIVAEQGLVVAFEPYSEAYERLEDNRVLNGSCNVRPFRLALSDHSGEGMLYSGWPDYAPTLRDFHGTANGFSWAERLRIVEGDRLVAEQRLPIPRAVKIDVEGAEDSVIRGLSRTLSDPGCELLCCEIHPGALPAGVTPDTILARINSLGFSRTEVRPRLNTLHALCRKF
jgi:FkbM family methyltransferase